MTTQYVIRREDRRAAGLYAVNGSDPRTEGYKYTDDLAQATRFSTAAEAAADLETRMAGYFAERAASFTIIPVKVQSSVSLFGY